MTSPFRFLPLLGLSALLACAATPALAQDAKTDAKVEADHNSLTFGIGGVYLPSYEGSNDYILTPAIAARGKVHDFSFFTRNTQLYVNAIPSQSGPGVDFELGPIIGVNFNRHTKLVDPQIKALGKRKLAAEAGGFIGIGKTGLITSDYDNLTVRVAYVHDISGIYKSYVITPQIQYTTPLSRKAFIGISASADYAGTGYATAYYDVDAAGALRSGLPVFTGRKGWKQVTFGMIGGHSLTGDLLHGLGLYFTGSYSRLQNDFAASPVTRIAGSPNQWFGAVGLVPASNQRKPPFRPNRPLTVVEVAPAHRLPGVQIRSRSTCPSIASGWDRPNFRSRGSHFKERSRP